MSRWDDNIGIEFEPLGEGVTADQCPFTATSAERCVLFNGHPGPHAFDDMGPFSPGDRPSLEQLSKRERAVADWLFVNGFPFAFSSLVDAPLWLLRPLAELWAERDGESVEDYMATIAAEQPWGFDE